MKTLTDKQMMSWFFCQGTPKSSVQNLKVFTIKTPKTNMRSKGFK